MFPSSQEIYLSYRFMAVNIHMIFLCVVTPCCLPTDVLPSACKLHAVNIKLWSRLPAIHVHFKLYAIPLVQYHVKVKVQGSLQTTGVLISLYPDQKGNKLMFLSEWREFPSMPCLAGKRNSSRLDVVEIARVPDMLPSLFPSWSG